ncbi:sensor histidine kinase [Streptomyces sp. CAI-85]|uniref:sensor histidine kinase n=1 Tax=Streptomyces sp. CAI-85 TaxID=1472662 RepID=UPI001587CD1B|nr:sensor histidine kinase [Streptomyces sp. CAI-85]NUV63595.1 sensor histidine kinase [Streptomyces sp. CAI-85]
MATASVAAPAEPVFRIDRTAALVGVCQLLELGWIVLGRTADGAVAALASCAAATVGWLSLGFRARRPLAAAVVALLVTLVYYTHAGINGPTPALVFMVALYSVARSGQLTAVVALAVLIMLVIAYGELGVVDQQRSVDNMSIALLSGWFLSVIAFSHAMRTRQAYLAEAEARALAAERERDVRAKQSATEERLRLARELHDVLGHNISLIHVQTNAALHRSTRRPGQTAELITALEFVRDTSKEALRELRGTLGVLRQVDEAAPTAPTAGLDRLGELADRAAVTGLKVTVTVEGEQPVLSPKISLAAYRIVQESLTNITRHAQAAHATIDVTYTPSELRVRIEDDGQGTADTTTRGSGITGMTERARALGGRLTARDTGAGFRVDATLPLTETPQLPV